jgi:hypothetical protein
VPVKQAEPAHMAKTDFRRQAIERGEKVKEVPLAMLMMSNPDLFDVG